MSNGWPGTIHGGGRADLELTEQSVVSRKTSGWECLPLGRGQEEAGGGYQRRVRASTLRPGAQPHAALTEASVWRGRWQATWLTA